MRYLAFSLATLTCALGVVEFVAGGRRAAAGAGFTPAQAQQGSVVYKESCAQCHGANLEGGGGSGARRSDVPGRMALARRRRTGARDRRDDAAGQSRLARARRPPSASTAYILQRNGAATGPQELAASATSPISEVLAAKPATSAPPVLGAGRRRALWPGRSAGDPDHRRRPLRQPDGPGGAGALQGDAQAARRAHAGDRGDAAQSVAERLADVAAATTTAGATARSTRSTATT